MSKKKVLITGATGFVGANIVRFLVKSNYSAHILIRNTSNLWRIKDLVPKIAIYEVDLVEKELLDRTVKKIKPELIFHLANAPLYQGVHPSSISYIEGNLIGTINLIMACKDIDYQCFVNTGSSAEYGPKEKAMKEDDFCQPLSLYAVTKLAATNYSSYMGKIEKKPIVTLRLFSPFGPYDDPKRLMTEAIYNALENKPIFLSDPNLVRDYIYIDDVIGAYTAVIKRVKEVQGEIFNIGSGRQITIKEVVSSILKFTSSKSIIKWKKLSQRSFESKVWQADIEKAIKSLNWKPQYSFEEGIKETIKWFRINASNYKEKVRTFST